MVIESYGLSPHMYADDTHVYGSCRPSAVTTFTTKVSECVEATTSCMRSNRLQPNPEKTEVLWCATARRQHQLPTSPLLIDGCSVCTRPWYPYWQWPNDADARQTYCIAMFRFVAWAASHPSLGADSHTPDFGGCFGSLPTGLRK